MATEKQLIDRKWILGEIEHDIGCYEIEKLTPDDNLYVELKDVVKLICAAPTVDAVEVVHGYWEKGKKPNWQMPMCSACKAQATTRSSYCPHCGAKMDGDGNGS